MKRIKIASTFLAFLTLTATSVPVAFADDSSVTVKITNQSGQAADVFWVRPDGSEVKYGHLDPGQAYDQGTYSGHGWRAKGASGDVLGNFVAPSGGGTWNIGVNQVSAQQAIQATGQAPSVVQRSISELGTPEVTAAFYYNGIAYLFNGDLCIAYDLAKQAPNPGGPKSVKELWNHPFNVDGAFLGPNPGEVTFNYNAAGDLYYCVYPVVGQGPATKPGASGKASKQFPGSVGSPASALELPTGEVLFFNDPLPGDKGGNLQILDLATKTANAPFKGADGYYSLPSIESKFPGVTRVDAAFYVPESKEAYLFGGKYLWIYNFDSKQYVKAGVPIDSQLPQIAFKAATAPIAVAPTTMDDLQGVWQEPTSGLTYVIAQVDSGYKIRTVQTLDQGIASLKGSQTDRENARREFPTQLVGNSPQAMTARESSNGDTEYKLLNPSTLEMRYPKGGGVYGTIVFTKKSGAAQVTAQGVAFDEAKPVTLTFQGHPALALTSGTIEFSFKPSAPSGPLFGAQGRFYMDYDANGLSTFNGRINTPVKIGDWNHLILSSDGFVTNVALNGQPVGSLSDGLYMGNEERITFGARDNTPYKGEMKNVRIWDAAIPLELLYDKAGKTLAGSSDLRADLKPFLLAEDGKVLKEPKAWENELKGKTVYIAAYETVKVGDDPLRAVDRRAAISLGVGDTPNNSAYIAADATGSPEQIFTLKPIDRGYYTLETVGSGVPAAVADAVEHFEYGKLVFQSNGTTTNTRLVVDGRHLAAGTSKTRDPKYSQFRFIRQAVPNNGKLELAWIIQPRAAADHVEATKSAFTPYGSFQVQDSLDNEIIQLDKHALGGAFKCSPYNVSEAKQRLFTVFPALATAIRPKAIKLANFGKSIKELRTRRDNYAKLPTAQKFDHLYFVAPPTNDPTGNVAALMQEFNRYYATIGTTNATVGSGNLCFEEEFLRRVPAGPQAEAGALDTDSLGRKVDSAFASFRVDPAIKAKYPNVTEQDFVALQRTLSDRLNNRAALHNLIIDYRFENAKLTGEDHTVRQQLQSDFGVTPQADIEIVRRQDPEAFFGVENGFSALGLATAGGGLISEEFGGGVDIVSFFVDVAMLEKQIIEFSLSQLKEDETVSAYRNGDEAGIELNRKLALSFDAAARCREAVFTDLAELPLYDPSMLEEIYDQQVALKPGKAAAYAKAEEIRRRETRKGIFAAMLPVYGAILGVSRDTKFATAPGTDTFAGGAAHNLDNMYNDLEHYAAPGALATELTRKNYVAASMYKNPDGTQTYYSWHLVKRPASAKCRNFADAIMNDARSYFANPRELMKVMANATYASASRYEKSPGVFDNVSGAEVVGQGEGIWLDVPNGQIGSTFTVAGSAFKGVNTGHEEEIASMNFVQPPSELTLFYWPQPNKPWNNSTLATGFILPAEAPKEASGSRTFTQTDLERQRRGLGPSGQPDSLGGGWNPQSQDKLERDRRRQ